MKTGKELKINDFKSYNILYGSVNNKHPKAVYINVSAWAEPKVDSNVDSEINYNRVIGNINKLIKQTLHNSFASDKNTEFIKERTIIDLDIRESGIKYGKRSFMSCEITLFLDIEIPVTSELMKDKLNVVTTLLIDKIFDSNQFFSFHKKKN